MKFKLFLETNLVSFVQDMLQNRYDLTDRLVAADWLEDQGDILGKYIHAAQAVSTNPDNGRLVREWDRIRNIVHDDFVTRFGIYIDFLRGTISTTNDLYQIKGNHIAKNIKRMYGLFPVKDINKLPEGVLRGVVAILGYNIVPLDQHNNEARHDFMRAEGELDFLIQRLKTSLQRGMALGWNNNHHIPTTDIRRLRVAVEYVVSSAKNEDDKDTMKIRLRSFRNFLAMNYIHEELQKWLTAIIEAK